MADGHDQSTRELGRRRGNAISAALLAAGVTGTVALAGWTAWGQTHDTASAASASDGTSAAQGSDAQGFGQGGGPGRQGGFDQGQQGQQSQGQQSQGQQGQSQQGGGFPQLGGSAGPGQAGSSGS